MLPLPLGRLAYQDITIHAEMSAILGVRILRLLEAVKLRKPIDVASLAGITKEIASTDCR